MSTTAPDERFTTYTPVVPTTEFPALFPIFANDDLSVYLDGVERFDFTVTASYVEGVSNNAKVIMNSSVTGSVVIAGERDPRRQNRFLNGGALPIKDMNLAFDVLEGEMQEARRDIERSVRSEIGQPGFVLDPDLVDGDVPMKQGDRFVPGPNLPNLASSLIAEATAQANRAQEEADRADAEADRAAGYVNDIVSEKEVPITATRNGMASILLPPGMISLEVRGFAAIGDAGGAKYRRVSFADLTGYPALSYVRSLDRFMPNGTIDVVNGGYWVIDEKEVTPQMFGAVANGVADDLPAFQASADFSVVIGTRSVDVPNGSYNLSGYVSADLQITWIIGQNVTFTGGNAQYLNGRVIRPSRLITDMLWGRFDSACGRSVITGQSGDPQAAILGVSYGSGIATYVDRDSAADFIKAKAQPSLFTSTNATYAQGSVTTTNTGIPWSRLKVGMVIDTLHTTKYSAFITSWDEASKTIYVEGWYAFGNTSDGQIPPSTAQFVVNPITKTWGQNVVIEVPSNAYGTKAVGREMGLNRSDSAGVSLYWGDDVVNLGSKDWAMAYLARGANGSFLQGLRVEGVSGAGVYVGDGSFFANGVVPTNGLDVRNGNTRPVYCAPGGVQSLIINNSGSMEIGSLGTAASVTLDFHSSGNPNDYDSRIIAQGGSTSAGQGSLSITGSVLGTPLVRPTTDNVVSCGDSSHRWTQIYATTGTINTSDERQKRDIELLSSDLAERFLSLIDAKTFKWVDEALDEVVEEYEEEIHKTESVARTETVERVEIVGGKAILRTEVIDVTEDVPLYNTYEMVDENGNPVFTRDQDGTLYQRTYKVPVIEKVVRRRVVTRAHEKENVRTHFGFIAQDFEKSLSELGITSSDFAGLIIDKETGKYGLRYEQVLTILWPVVKKLLHRVDELSARASEV
jgi:hypothetical protein